MTGKTGGHCPASSLPAVELADEEQPRLAVLEDVAHRLGIESWDRAAP